MPGKVTCIAVTYTPRPATAWPACRSAPGDQRRGHRPASSALPWPETYAITLSDAVWTARRRDNPDRVLTAGTAPGLRWQIRNDYCEWLRTRS